MNKEQQKHLLPNFLWCISSFMIPFFTLTMVVKTDLLISIPFSLYVYFIDVFGQTNNDYLSEKIKKLEDLKK
jgi:hypothetical protein